jgi:hypothetical protein
MRVEQCRAIAAEIEVADWIGVGSVLLPHEEQRKEFMYTLSAANRKGHSLPADRRRSEAPHLSSDLGVSQSMLALKDRWCWNNVPSRVRVLATAQLIRKAHMLDKKPTFYSRCVPNRLRMSICRRFLCQRRACESSPSVKADWSSSAWFL